MSARRPRPPGLVYSALSLALLVVLGTLTVTTTQTPPPAIAEFAPQAVEKIEEAPPEQSSESGEGEGGAPGEQAAASTSTTTPGSVGGERPTVSQARLRRCFGDPPRQTEDPQSPPCVPFFEGDNGGATARGVTADEIRVAVTRNMDEAHMRTIEAYFNKRFEFYGRKLKLTMTGSFGSACTSQRAEAVSIDSLEMFAATDAGTANSACLYDELARRKIIVSEVSYAFTEPQAAARHPYLWSYLMGVDRMMAATGEMACARLAGGTAAYSTDPATREKPRTYGVILQTANRDSELPVTSLTDALARCGITVKETVAYDFAQDNGTRGRDAVTRMQAAEVTTIICVCIIFVEATLGPSATAQNYYPEWVISSYGSNDFDVLVKSSWSGSRQRQALFGITVQPPQRPLSKEPAWAAYTEVDPNLRVDHATSINLITLYRSLLLLGSGIQLAGPKLTPETFASGLQRATFPNPADPTNSGAVGFLGPDHGMTDDAAEFWWSESVTGADGTAGGLCYVDAGTRRRPGRWPRGPAAFFVEPCRRVTG